MLSTFLVILTLALLYWFPVRRWFGRWGTIDEDLTRVMTGDAAVVDEIPIGRGLGFPVTAIEPYRALVLSGTGDGFAWLWEFGLYALDERRTRLGVA